MRSAFSFPHPPGPLRPAEHLLQGWRKLVPPGLREPWLEPSGRCKCRLDFRLPFQQLVAFRQEPGLKIQRYGPRFAAIDAHLQAAKVDGQAPHDETERLR